MAPLAAMADPRPTDFNLQSEQRSYRAGNLGGGSVAIAVGDKTRAVKMGDFITAGEFVAVQQMLASGSQNIVLNGRGGATAGTVNLASDLAASIKDLVIPRGVTALGDFSAASTLSMSGKFVNSGQVFAFSNNASSASGTFSAASIINQQGSVLSSVLPAMLAGTVNALPQFDLNLVAVKDIINLGTMSSSGNLNLTAGGSITNSARSAAQASTAVMSALNNVNMVANVINNFGSVSATAGNINVSAYTGNRIAFTGTNGVMEALNGNITFTVAATSVLDGIHLNGGNFYANRLILNGAKGTVSGEIGDSSAWIDISACNSFFGAAATNLKFGDLQISGDPTFFNTLGTLTIANIGNTAGANLALVAKQDVVVQGGTLDTTDMAADTDAIDHSGNLIIIAGANVSSDGGTSGSGDTTTTLTISQSALSTHGSDMGGAIDLSAVTGIFTLGAMNLDTTQANGGKVTLVAFSGDGTGSTLTPGSINVGNGSGSIQTFGGIASIGGDVKVIAGAATDPSGSKAIVLPPLFTGWSPTMAQGGDTGGSVLIATATPNLASNVQIKNGAVLSGTITAGTTQAAGISIGAMGGAGNQSVAEHISVTNWQNAVAQFNLTLLNGERAPADALSLDPAASVAALNYSAYIGQNGHFSHFAYNSSAPGGRINAVGLSPTASAENLGLGLSQAGFGRSLRDVAQVVHDDFMAEPAGQPNHRGNIENASLKSIGIGYAVAGNNIVFAQDFTNDPPSSGPTFSNIDLHGGMQGPFGAMLEDPGIPAPRGSRIIANGTQFVPTSIITGGKSVTITSGGTFQALGSIQANGQSGMYFSNFDPAAGAKPGGTINITAAGDITLPGGVQASGGIGTLNDNVAAGLPGAAGGTINITSTLGDITILPDKAHNANLAPCAPCLAISAAGGAGGQALQLGATGGDGGDGGHVTLSAVNGDITVTAIDVGGGGGAGGAGGGVSGGIPGAGGDGGTITITAGGKFESDYYLNASGAGGGGAGGAGSNGGGGGGGASMAMAGSGAAGASSSAKGGGGSFGNIPGIGGPSVGGLFFLVQNSTGADSAGNATGGTAGLLGGGGGGGSGGGGANNGGAGGALGTAGSANSSGSQAGGASGNGGDITINADQVIITGTTSSYWDNYTLASGIQGGAVLALGQNGSINITTTTGTALTYNTNLDLGTSTTSQVTLSGNTFTVGSATGTSHILGGLFAGGAGETNTITINGVVNNSPVTSGGFPQSGFTSVTINLGGTDTFFSGTFNATPAMVAAMIQKAMTGTQPLTLDANGVATAGGSFSIDNTFLPNGGFATLALPTGVTLVQTQSLLTFNTSATVNGTISTGAGSFTLATPTLTLNGAINSGGNYTVTGTNTAGQMNVTFGNAATVSATNFTIANSAANAGLNVGGQPLGITATQSTIDAVSGNLTFSSNTNLAFTGAAQLIADGAGQSITLNNTTQISATSTLALITSSLNLGGGTLTGNPVQISNNASNPGLTISGTGTINAPVGGTQVTANSGNLVINNNANITFDGITSFIASGTGQGVTLNTGVNLDVPGGLVVFTANFNPGTATINGPVVVNAPGNGVGVIANPTGDVVLPISLTFIGTSLAILAAGNIIAGSSSKGITLSSSIANGGTLTMMSGVTFNGPAADPAFKVPTLGIYTLTGFSASGGSVLMPKVAINTSSTFAGGDGGGVQVFAHSGAVNSGMISLGSIKTSGSLLVGGVGGGVLLAGGGGVQTGVITTTGATGGAVTITGAQPTLTGQVNVFNGTLVGPGTVGVAPASLTNGAAIYINGLVNTNGSLLRGGSVTLTADRQIELTAGVTATGLAPGATGGGDVLIDSMAGKITTGSAGINTSALSVLSAGARAGNAGAILLSGTHVLVGSLIARGGTNTGAGPTADGGNGANITVFTGTVDVAGTPFSSGLVKVTGFVDARGGAANKSVVVGADGGSGGTIVLSGAAVAVTGNISGASIISSGGLGGPSGAAGGDGGIDIDTFALQTLPASLDLTTLAKSIPILPGALFTIGVSSPVNGVAGTIVKGATIINKLTNGNGQVTAANNINTNGVTVTINGNAGALQITEGGVNVPAALTDLTGKRTQLTPSEAMAYFDASRLNPQGLTINAFGQTTTGIIILDQVDLNSASFTSFKLPDPVVLNITGNRPTLNLPSGSLINGDINFTTAATTAYVGYGTANLTIGATGQITGLADSTGIFGGSGSTITNNGLVRFGQLALVRGSTSGLTFIGGAGSQTTFTGGAATPRILIGSGLDAGLTFTFKTLGADIFDLPVVFGDLPVPTQYKAEAQGLATNAAVSRKVVLTLSLAHNTGGIIDPFTGTVGGTVNAASIKIIGSAASALGFTVQTPIQIADAANLKAASVLSITTPAAITIGDNIALTAGVLKSTAPNFASATLLASTDITTAGTMTISSTGLSLLPGGITIGNSNTFTNNGPKLLIQAKLGNVAMGNSNTMTDMGGNVVIMAKGTLTGGNLNAFQAKGIVNTSTGGLEFMSGTLSEALGAGFSKVAGTNPAPASFGSNVTINNSNGAVTVNRTLGAGGTTPTLTNSTMTLSRGAIVFDVAGAQPGAAITFTGANGSTFVTKSSRPVAFVQAIAPDEKVVLPADSDLDVIDNHQQKPLAQIVAAAGSEFAATSKGHFTFTAGEVLVASLAALTIETPAGTVIAQPGALFHLSCHGDNVYVKGCDNLKDVVLLSHNHGFHLLPGQEIAIVPQTPTQDDLHPSDGVGRRNQHVEKMADDAYVVASDFSLVTLLNTTTLIKSAGTHQAKLVKLRERMLKTAAALDVVTHARGNYQATAKAKEPARDSSEEAYAAAALVTPNTNGDSGSYLQ